jgi:hypothetical protein
MKMKKRIIVVVVLMLILATSLVACTWEVESNIGSNEFRRANTGNYIESTKIWTPFEESHGVSVTYETVMNRYLSSVKWQEEVNSNDTGFVAYVTVFGKLNDVDGNELDIEIVVRIRPHEIPNMLWFEPHKMGINGRVYDGMEASGEFIRDFYMTYIGEFDSVVDYFINIGSIEQYYLETHG